MAETARGMGRGLSAILAVSGSEAAPERREVPLDLIIPNRHQPRRHFDEGGLVALADSLGARGVLQPVLVRPVAGGLFELIAGERRWRAAGLAGLDVVPVIVRHEDDATSLELALIENMAREDLNPVEEARACAALVDELGLTQAEVGRRVGRGRVAVANLLRLLDLPDEALELIASAQLSAGHGRALLMTADHAERRRLARESAARGWSVRTLEDRARAAARRARGTRRRRVPLDTEHEAALEQVGAELTSRLGASARVAPDGAGCRVELRFESVADALSAVRRLGLPAAA